MPITSVKSPDGSIIEVQHPEGASEEEIIAYAQANASTAAPQSSNWYDAPRLGTLAALQGATFGFGDELLAAGAAIPAAIATGTSPVDAYRDMQASISGEQKAYAQQNPWTAGLLELGGGILTGGVSGAKALPGLIARTSSLLPAAVGGLAKPLAAATLGAAQGGLYGAGAADSGERLEGAGKGAAIGAVAAPVLGVVAEKGGDAVGAFAKWAANKLAGTPRGDAERAVRQMAERAGLSADEVIDRYRRLGSEAMLADTDETMRRAARAAADQVGPVANQARGLLEARQLGSSGRLSSTLQDTLGVDAGDFNTMIKQLRVTQSAKADPLYAQARQEGSAALSTMRDDYLAANPNAKEWEWLGLGDRPSLASAIRSGVKAAKDAGDDPGDNLMSILDSAKQGLDSKIERFITSGQKKSARPLLKLKSDLLAVLDDVSPAYKEARDTFAGDAALLDAAKKGRMFFKLDAEDLMDLSQGMSQSEREMFRRGAAKEIVQKLDDMSLTHDPSKIVNKKSLLDRYNAIFDAPDQAERFIRQALSEREFARTRQIVTGGSMTSTNVQAGQGLDEAVQPDALVSFLSGQPAAGALAMARDILGRKKLDPETLGQIGNILLTKGVPETEIRRILTQPPMSQKIGLLGQAYPAAARGAVTPAVVGLLQ